MYAVKLMMQLSTQQNPVARNEIAFTNLLIEAV